MFHFEEKTRQMSCLWVFNKKKITAGNPIMMRYAAKAADVQPRDYDGSPRTMFHVVGLKVVASKRQQTKIYRGH